MAVKRLRQVFIAASDFATQCAFYERTLDRHGAVRGMGSHGKMALCCDPAGATFVAQQK